MRVPSETPLRLVMGQAALRRLDAEPVALRLCPQLTASQGLKLELAQCGRELAPARNGPLGVQAKPLRKFNLRAGPLDGFVFGHASHIGMPLSACQADRQYCRQALD